MQIPIQLLVQHIVDCLCPPETLERTEFDLRWEQLVSRSLDDIDAQAEDFQRQQRMQALTQGIAPPQVPPGVIGGT